MKHGKKSFMIIEAVLGILVILVLGFIIYKQNGHEPETIAVIIPDVDESEWSAFKYGLKMAAREYDANVVIISKDNMETANEEIGIMNQEIIKGADAVIVKPIANQDGQQKLKQLEKSKVNEAIGQIRNDFFDKLRARKDTEMPQQQGVCLTEGFIADKGADLAQKLLENYRGNLIGKKIGIYSQYATSEAVIKRKKGICDTLKGSGAEILWSVSKENDSKEKINLQTQRRVDIVMALDNASFVEAGEAAKDNDLYGAVLYGIGNSTEAVYYLDAGWAQCLVAPDEFDAGYESVAELIKKRRNFFYKMKDRQITYTVLTRENLFSEENRNLLFTISR